jgi:hypothetical protein
MERVKIKLRMRVAAAVCLFAFLLGFGVSTSTACSTSSVITKIGRNFSAGAVNQGRPVVGLQIELSTDPEKADEESRSVLILTTGLNGLVAFELVKPGRYYVAIKHFAYSYSAEILLQSRVSKSSSHKVVFEWPGVKPLSVQFVSGPLNTTVKTGNLMDDTIHPVYGPLAGAKLTLLQAVSQEAVESQVASESGAFNFHPAPSGLYFLHVESLESRAGSYSADGYVPIEVNPSIGASTLNLFLFPGICGSLGYENRQGIPQ